jgi:hypothetical protein
VDARDVTVRLTPSEVALLRDALDSHEYWQLSEPHERNDGFSTIRDGEKEEIDAVRALIAKLERSRGTTTS